MSLYDYLADEPGNYHRFTLAEICDRDRDNYNRARGLAPRVTESALDSGCSDIRPVTLRAATAWDLVCENYRLNAILGDDYNGCRSCFELREGGHVCSPDTAAYGPDYRDGLYRDEPNYGIPRPRPSIRRFADSLAAQDTAATHRAARGTAAPILTDPVIMTAVAPEPSPCEPLSARVVAIGGIATTDPASRQTAIAAALETNREPLTERLADLLAAAFTSGSLTMGETIAVSAAVDFIMTDGTSRVVDTFSRRYGRIAALALRTADGREVI